MVPYFYPRPPRGGRPSRWKTSALTTLFLSTPSARRATGYHLYAKEKHKISIHALREEGDEKMMQLAAPVNLISIHALREEGDDTENCGTSNQDYFYPRPLRGGRRAKAAIEDADEIFLSTPSARRATGRAYHTDKRLGDFYPRPLRGGRPAQKDCFNDLDVISIHALCEEGD